MKSARAVAHTNIALVKYWGKRESLPDLNLPAVGSLSLTLDRLRSDTVVCPAEQDSFTLNEEPGAPDVAAKVARHLDRVWQAAWYHKPLPTFADALALVRREIRGQVAFCMSERESELVKIPRALVKRFADALFTVWLEEHPIFKDAKK